MGFWDDLTGKAASDAANAAAADQYAKQQAATQKITAYGDTLPGQYNELSKAYDPLVGAGNDALKRLMAGLGLGSAEDNASFTKAYHDTPGYQSGLDTGTTAAMRGLNAGPGLQSGAALKALTRFGSDYENSRAGDYLSRLFGLTSTGASATGAKVGTQATGIGANTGIRTSAYGGDMNSSGTIGQGMVAGANAEAAGSQNLLNAGLKLGGMALGGFGMPSFAGSTGGSFLGGLMSPSGSNPFNPDGSRNTMAYG